MRVKRLFRASCVELDIDPVGDLSAFVYPRELAQTLKRDPQMTRAIKPHPVGCASLMRGEVRGCSVEGNPRDLIILLAGDPKYLYVSVTVVYDFVGRSTGRSAAVEVSV